MPTPFFHRELIQYTMKHLLLKLRATLVMLLLTASLFAQFPYVFDMVHHNPGEVHFVTNYNNPEVIKSIGDNGKVFFLFESGVLGINWDSFDKDIFPAGSAERDWVTAKAAEIKKDYDAAKAAGLQVYCMSDLILFPKNLVTKYGMSSTFTNIGDTLTQKMLREELRMMFRDFPQLDGIVVRIGETYMQDAPYHQGGILNKTSTSTIVPLIQILREEVCVKLNKRVFFRTWNSFDTNLTTYNAVSAAIEPHDNLIISVKHCEGDFHRGNPFSKVLGAGRHKQIVEVQCAREYEGKGAFPNYIANGVIDGFEEYKNTMPTAPITSLKQLYASSPLLSGVWTWSKGGGWDGPYMTNDLWNELNTWVMSKWAQNPSRSEADIFNEYATQVLGLTGKSVAQFRSLALLSAAAVIRGHRSTFADIDVWWTRDHYISAPPALPTNAVAQKRVLDQKHEAVAMFQRIIELADSIEMPNKVNQDYMRVSARYGYYLHQIYAIAFDLKYLSLNALSGRPKIDSLLVEYDAAWARYNALLANNPSCATLYKDKAFRNTTTGSLGEFIASLRVQPQGLYGKYISNLQSGILTNVITIDTNPAVGKLMYTDRTYKFTAIPDVLTQGEYVLWKNDYKNYTNNPMMVFSTNTDGTVYIAHDDRLTRPSWLTQQYENTGLSYPIQDTKFTLFSKQIKKNDIVTCGENHLMGNLSSSTQYMVFFVPNEANAVQETLADEVKYYIDKDRRLVVKVPLQMVGSEYQIVDISGCCVMSGKLNQSFTRMSIERGYFLLKVTCRNKMVLSRKIVN